ncbi:TPA: SDR family oxidoreductase [Elizabethkingia anophelis]|uniref:Short-chain dehydrogenase n=1 Tax=Elizabethkingia anophelis R26 TaxID=1246994 RepID=A0ABM6MNS8_9FLAO|nr:SDR family oxidoreductase [Elizabethkingia anophelis]ATC34682.1 short-chain dehydrogenase [Elizabethkingia anophelis R26]ATC38323.1 short-chain dehydrogenase [Elizabethkingia anophelis Ag1]ATC42004.1 short-chain dehydrogenase [Elizabethkingia anophelis]ATC45680.1 short-chain dehydrogenase [Elizabethkingia anophelis]ELR78258.1 short chain dehydrogenase [Elizabethkingia anophelis R26]
MSKTILITGAASGFGKIAAFELAKREHKVIATTQVYPQMSDLIREAGEKKIDLIVDKLDVTNPRDIAYAHKKYDIDILISNAGIMEGGPIAEQPLELIRSMFEVNVFGALELAQGFIKKFVAKKSGKIVFTSSMGGLWTVPYVAAYCASKHALEAIAEGLKTELEPFGIKVATCNPGVFGTGFNDRGVDSISRWYDPGINFTPPSAFDGAAESLAHQLDPQSMAEVIVDVALNDHSNFRNVHPKETEDFVKQLQAEAWNAKS